MKAWKIIGVILTIGGLLLSTGIPPVGAGVLALGLSILFWVWVLQNLRRHFELLEQQNAILFDVKAALDRGFPLPPGPRR